MRLRHAKVHAADHIERDVELHGDLSEEQRARRDWKEGRFPKVPGDDVEFVPLP